MPAPDVKFDPETRKTLVGEYLLSINEVRALRVQLEKVVLIEQHGYGDVDGHGNPLTWTMRWAESVLAEGAPKAWRPGMKPIFG